MRDLPPMVRLEATRLHWGRTRQAGTAADGPSRTTRNKSPRCMRAQHKGSSPSKPLPAEGHSNHNRCRNRLLKALLSGLHRPGKLSRPTDCRLLPSGSIGNVPCLGTTSANLGYSNCEKMAGTAHGKPPKSNPQLVPSQGRCVCGLKLRSSESRPLWEAFVGRWSPLSFQIFELSRTFPWLTGPKPSFSQLLDRSPPPSERSTEGRVAFACSVGNPTPICHTLPSSPAAGHPSMCSRLHRRSSIPEVWESIFGWERMQATCRGSSQSGWHTRTRTVRSPPSSRHWMVTESHISSPSSPLMRWPTVTERLSAPVRKEPTGLAEQLT